MYMDCIFFLNKKFAFTDAVTRATGFHGDETQRRQHQPAIRRHTRNAHNNNNSLCANIYCRTDDHQACAPLCLSLIMFLFKS